jgi:hypothetical protein
MTLQARSEVNLVNFCSQKLCFLNSVREVEVIVWRQTPIKSIGYPELL